MAGRIATTTAGNNPPAEWHHGNQVAWNFEAGNVRFGTTSDALVLAKIPSGATVLDFFTRFATLDAQSTVRAELQDPRNGALLAVIAAAATASTGGGGGLSLRPGIGSQLPYTLSLSDDAAVRYANLVLNVQSGTETTSVSVAGYVSYASR
jgi:hypothetical protein